MVDRDDTQIPGSITEKADTSGDRISEISNVSKTISEMQRKTQQKIQETRRDVAGSENIEHVERSMSKVLSSLNNTVGTVTDGFAKVAANTARASSDLIKGYGKAISQDISYNKQNVVSMALARSTPLYGYFAAKFMETDVYQKAKERMKSSLSDALGSVTSKFKEGFTSLFSRGKGKPERSLASKAKEEIPKMQRGGYVEKGGVARLHPAEVVVPIEKVLERIDKSIDTTKELAKSSTRMQMRSLSKLSTYIHDGQQKEKVGIIKGFFRAIKEAEQQYMLPPLEKLVRIGSHLLDALGVTFNKWSNVWKKMLIEHPTFRNIMFALNTLKNVLGTPGKLIYSIFKTRGGYTTHLSANKNPMAATAENIGVLYTGSMWRLDNIAKFTRASAEATRDLSSALTGKSYPRLEGVGTGVFTLFGLGRSLVNSLAKITPKIAGGVVGLLMGGKIKKGLTIGEAIGNALTSPDYFDQLAYAFKSAREREIEGIYGKGGAVEALPGPKSFQEAITTISPLEVVDVNFKRLFDDIQKFVQLNAKQQKKLLGQTDMLVDISRGNYKTTKEMNQREERRTIFGFMSGIFGAGKGILGSIMKLFTGGMGLLGLLGLGRGGGIGRLLTKILAPSLAISASSGIIKAFGKLFPGGLAKKISLPIKTAITGMGTKIVSSVSKLGPLLVGLGPKIIAGIQALGPTLAGILKNPLIWKAAAIGGAFKVGWEIGQYLDKTLGISKRFQSILDKWDKVADQQAQQVQKTITKGRKAALETGGKEGYKGLVGVKLATQIGRFAKERRSDVGVMGRSNLVAIDAAQRAYMWNNIDKYMNYDPAEIAMIREKWLAEGGYRHRGIFDNAERYGRQREAAFLTYLQKNAKELSPAEAKRRYEEYAKKFKASQIPPTRGAGSTITERGAAFYKRASELAGEATAEAKARAESLRKTVKEGIEQASTTVEGVGKGIASTVQQSTNIISTTVSNSQRVINSGAGKLDYFTEYAGSVLRGDIDSD